VRQRLGGLLLPREDLGERPVGLVAIRVQGDRLLEGVGRLRQMAHQRAHDAPVHVQRVDQLGVPDSLGGPLEVALRGPELAGGLDVERLGFSPSCRALYTTPIPPRPRTSSTS
jgi:hypothetical protein